MLTHISLILGCMSGSCVLELAPSLHNGMIMLHTIACIHSGVHMWMSDRRIKIPIKWHVLISAIYTLTNMINLNVWRFGISHSFQMVFRSCSLLTNMLVGLGFGRKYERRQILSAIIITIGMLLVSWSNINLNDLKTWSAGVFLMALSVLLATSLGYIGANIYSIYGWNQYECIFFHHILGLPLLIPFMNIERMNLLWSLMFAIPQYICIRSVHKIQARYDSYHLTLIITIRKMCSQLLSAIWDCHRGHWIGAGLVFGGILIHMNKKH